MAAAARTVLSLGIDDLLDVRIGGAHSSAEGSPCGQVKGLALVNVDARGPNRVVKEQFAEVPFRLSGSKARIHGTIRLSGQGNVSIRRRNLQFVDASNLLVDEPAQLRGAVALSGGESAPGYEKKPERSRTRYVRLEEMQVNRFFSIHGHSKMPFLFVLHVRVPPKVESASTGSSRELT